MRLIMKRNAFLAAAVTTLAIYVLIQVAGWGRERTTLMASYVTGDSKNGSIEVWVEGPFRVGLVYTYDNVESEYIEDDVCPGDPRLGFLTVDVEEGGWIDCQIGRCGRVTVRNYISRSCDVSEPLRRLAWWVTERFRDLHGTE